MIMNGTLFFFFFKKEKVYLIDSSDSIWLQKLLLKSINSERWDLLDLWVELY